MNQARRGLADTALSIGVDVSSRISILYAPPAAWSHGYLWGANVVTIPRGAAFSPLTNAITKPSHFRRRRARPRPGRPVRAEDRLAHRRPDAEPAARRRRERAEIALGSFTTPEGESMPAGSAIFAGDPAAATMLAATARDAELRFKRVRAGNLPSLEPIEAVPRIAVLVGAVDQNVWTLRNLGFTADPVSVATINSARRTRCSATTLSTTPAIGPRPRTRSRGRG